MEKVLFPVFCPQEVSFTEKVEGIFVLEIRSGLEVWLVLRVYEGPKFPHKLDSLIYSEEFSV